MWKEGLHSDGHQFHQYQQNEQSSLILTELTEHKKSTICDVGNSGPGLCMALYVWCKQSLTFLFLNYHLNFRPFLHSWLIIWFVTRVTRRVPLVEQELLTLPEYPSTPPVFRVIRVAQTLVFCVVFDRSLFVFLVLNLSAIIFAVLLQFTASD